MKETLNKIGTFLKTIYGYGIMISLFAGGLTFIGYLVALVIGGETATLICTFIYKKFIPVIIYIASIMVILGIISMYLCGQIALSVNDNKKK